MAASSSSSPFFGGTTSTREVVDPIKYPNFQQQLQQQQQQQNPQQQQQQQQQQQHSSSEMPPSASSAQNKKKRTLPGAPSKYPDAEVIALSPKTLMATNRFICEVCNKGFQREQNLQLHRRGHNLPWKLRQRAKDGSGGPVRKKVYLCPEPTCVHHDPARALGDLTGIKKHYFRKHGEKKYKCDKCSKRYAVQSDWKAHSKTCGTREYRCDCGTLFSRRDSFITHRAFCDALAQESARHPAATSLATLGSHLFGGAGGTNNMGLGVGPVGMGLSHQISSQLQSLSDHHNPNPTTTDILRLGGGTPQFDHHLLGVGPSSFRQQQGGGGGGYYLQNTQATHGGDAFGPTNDQQENQNQSGGGGGGLGIFSNKLFPGGAGQLPDLQGNFNLGFFSNEDSSTTSATTTSTGSLFGGPPMTLPGGGGANHLSSLYAAGPANAHMSATALLQRAAQMGSTTSASSKQAPPPSAGFSGGVFGDHQNNLNALMNTLTSTGGDHTATGAWGPTTLDNNNNNNNNNSSNKNNNLQQQLSGSGFNPNKKPGLGSTSDGLTRDFLGVGEVVRNMSGGIASHIEQQQHQQHQQHGMSTSNMTDNSSQAFGGGNSFQ